MVGTRADARRLSSRSGYTRTRTVGRYGYGIDGLTPARDWAMLTGDPYGQVAPASEREAMGLPPFGRGVDLLCNAVAGTDWAAVRFDPELGVSIKRPTQPGVLTRPDPSTTSWHYRWSTVQDLIMFGNHFALCGSTDWQTRRPGWLVPVHADRVGALIDPDTGRVWYVLDGETVEPYDPDPGDPGGSVDALPDYTGQLLHISAGNRSGELFGLGVLAQYGAWLGGSVAAETYAGTYFAGGTLPPAVLQSPTVLTQTQADELKSKWRDMTSTREPVVLPSGYVLTPIVSNAVDAQLVESRQWNAAEVAMMLGIPSYKLGLQGASMTYQNIESADIEWVRDSVDRYAGPIAAAFSQWLMPAGTSVAWDYAHRMRADQKTTADVLAVYTGAGILTVDEARAQISRPPLPESDEQPPAPPNSDQTAEPVPAPEADDAVTSSTASTEGE